LPCLQHERARYEPTAHSAAVVNGREMVGGIPQQFPCAHRCCPSSNALAKSVSPRTHPRRVRCAPPPVTALNSHSQYSVASIAITPDCGKTASQSSSVSAERVRYRAESTKMQSHGRHGTGKRSKLGRRRRCHQEGDSGCVGRLDAAPLDLNDGVASRIREPGDHPISIGI
jgi:hypothetical protein